jgi:caffeoyl-CoA O-methyltransferase
VLYVYTDTLKLNQFQIKISKVSMFKGFFSAPAVTKGACKQRGEASPASKEVRKEAPSYEEWKLSEVTKAGKKLEMDVHGEVGPDTSLPDFLPISLFHDGAEEYAMAHTSMCSRNIKYSSEVASQAGMMMHCMVGAMESQFLKMICQLMRAKRCLDVGTYTGMSAIAMAEGIPIDGTVVTLECKENVGRTAQKAIDTSTVANKIELRVGKAVDSMREMVKDGEKFDIIFIDADKVNYIEYYELSLQIIEKDGLILADNSLCSLLFDQSCDHRCQKLHEFNQYVLNDSRTEQVVLTVREGITMIKLAP